MNNLSLTELETNILRDFIKLALDDAIDEELVALALPLDSEILKRMSTYQLSRHATVRSLWINWRASPYWQAYTVAREKDAADAKGT